MNTDFMTIQTLVSIVQGVLIVAIAVLVARLKERPPMFWAMMSLFFGIYALFVLVLLPNAKKADIAGKEKTALTPNMMPKVPESHEEDASREEITAPLSVDSQQPSVDQLSLADWFYVGEQKAVVGPVTLKEMQGLVADKVVTSSSWVWCEFLSSWKKVKDDKQINDLLGFKEIYTS